MSRENGQWDGDAVSAWPGAADSFGMMINSAGYIYTSLHLVSAGELWAVTNPAIAGAGLYLDADGDGWTGMQELSCGTGACLLHQSQVISMKMVAVIPWTPSTT